MPQHLWVGTRKGLFGLENSSDGWHIASRSFLGDPVSMVLPDSATKRVYAALSLGHFGAKYNARTTQAQPGTRSLCQSSRKSPSITPTLHRGGWHKYGPSNSMAMIARVFSGAAPFLADFSDPRTVVIPGCSTKPCGKNRAELAGKVAVTTGPVCIQSASIPATAIISPLAYPSAASGRRQCKT